MEVKAWGNAVRVLHAKLMEIMDAVCGRQRRYTRGKQIIRAGGLPLSSIYHMSVNRSSFAI